MAPTPVKNPASETSEDEEEEEEKPMAGAAADGDKKVKKKKKSKKETYKIHIFKVLKQIYPEMSISSKALTIVNNFLNEMFEKITQEASRIAGENNTDIITTLEIQTAVDLVLAGEHAKHAISVGTQAVTMYCLPEGANLEEALSQCIRSD